MSSTDTAPYAPADLTSLTTFGLPAQAQYYAYVESVEALQEALTWGHQQDMPILPLGGGSNMIFVEDFEGMVIHLGIKGHEIVYEDESTVRISIGGGENWHDLVHWSVTNGYQGIENLALIPGTVGAAPIQNIGAYGIELQDVFYSLEAVDRTTGKRVTLTQEECQFGYRDSVFKQPASKGRWLITSVTIQLNKNGTPNTEYRSLQQWLQDRDIHDPTAQQVMEAVIAIRQSKLPNPTEIGNAGSFFKNPVVSTEVANAIEQQYPNMPSYKINKDEVKIPAGWLIEQAGWKGESRGNVGCFEKQALVLVNRGGATGKDVLELAQAIKQSVYDLFNIQLQAEVNIINKSGYTTLS